MKRYIFLILCLIAFALAGCSEEAKEPVVTFEISTTEPTTQAPITEEPSTEVTEQPPAEPLMAYEAAYDCVEMSRDSVGNVWLNVVAAVRNTTQDAICLRQGTLLITADGEEFTTIEDAVCYPNVIEPGECGFYYERICVDTDVTENLRAEVLTNAERAIDTTCEKIETYQLHDMGYGIEVHGNFEMQTEKQQVCVAAVLFDLNGDPVAIMSDFVDATQTQFVLSSDKLPAGLHSSLVTAKVFVYEYDD